MTCTCIINQNRQSLVTDPWCRVHGELPVQGVRGYYHFPLWMQGIEILSSEDGKLYLADGKTLIAH